MKFLRNLQKSVKAHHLLVLGVIVAAVALYVYSSHKSSAKDSMTNNSNEMEQQQNVSASRVISAVQGDSNVQPSAPLGNNEEYARVQGLDSRASNVKSCSKQAMEDPASLLPRDENSEWARLNPSGNGTLDNVNLLKAGHHIGIDTVGQSLRNANLQVRSEPSNPQVNVGPWNNTTIQPDLMRVPLELGCGPQ